MGRITDREIRERLIVSGADRLTDGELLAVIIREGTETLSAVELAEKILEDFAGGAATEAGALPELASASVQRIRRAAGCGTTRAASIAAAAEFARRIASRQASEVNTIVSKDDVVKLFAHLAELGHEEFWVLYLTSGGRVLDRARLSQGGVAGTVVDHKLVVKRAVELLASSLILIHNHPSGVARPSADDSVITETVGAAAALFDINVVDHIIISRSGSYSFAENGLMPSGRR
jgi:DNA repair protein RadC